MARTDINTDVIANQRLSVMVGKCNGANMYDVFSNHRLAALLGVVLIGSGVTKVIGESHQAAMFATAGLPVWFRLLVGTFEVIGGILLALPVSDPAGSLILSTIMVGALWTHVAQGEWRQVVPVSVLLAMLLLIFRQNQARAIQLLGGA